MNPTISNCTRSSRPGGVILKDDENVTSLRALGEGREFHTENM
jgi:hypothetical protein